MGDNKELMQVWDVVVVGGGPAGCAAAMVLARMRRKVLIIDAGSQRNQKSKGMHNYLSRDGILPGVFLAEAHRELDRYHVNIRKAMVKEARKNVSGNFEVLDAEGSVYMCRRLLLATGVTDIIPNVDGMERLWGKGVYHCPYCDGFELCDKNIGLYSKKINGFGMALSLRHLTKNIILFTDGNGYLKKYQIVALQAQGVTVVTTKLKELHCNENGLTSVGLANGDSIPCDAVFVNNGHRVNNELAVQLGARCTKKGATITNRKQQCSVQGLYVAGDAAIDIHFVAVAAAEGTKAAVSIHDDLMKEENDALLSDVVNAYL